MGSIFFKSFDHIPGELTTNSLILSCFEFQSEHLQEKKRNNKKTCITWKATQVPVRILETLVLFLTCLYMVFALFRLFVNIKSFVCKYAFLVNADSLVKVLR